MSIHTAYGDGPGTLTSQGGHQKVKARTKFENFIYGDSDAIASPGIGGNDTVVGARGTDPLAPTVNNLFGDAGLITDAVGGNDRVRGKIFAENFLYGDSLRLEATTGKTARGGDDRITGADNAVNIAYGDGFDMIGAVTGGNDTLRGGDTSGDSGASNTLHGDGSLMQGAAVGGNDLLRGGFDASNVMYGDAFRMLGDTVVVITPRVGGDLTASGGLTLGGPTPGGAIGMPRGGNDTLRGGDAGFNVMHGDASEIQNGQGGDDLLVGGHDGAVNIMYGDAFFLNGIAGDDTLVSGTNASDEMWGDARNLGPLAVTGRDVFVFGRDNGQDAIMDFRQGEDLIDLTRLAGLGIHSIADLTISVVGADSVIDFGGGNSVTVKDETALASTDFLFA
jgi:hypothetical protein